LIVEVDFNEVGLPLIVWGLELWDPFIEKMNLEILISRQKREPFPGVGLLSRNQDPETRDDE
jgi:hypothetical protein